MKWHWAVGLVIVSAASIAAHAAGQEHQTEVPPKVSVPAMDAHLRFLANDLLRGRAPATRGGQTAALYIATQFEALGLEPGGPNGSFFQPVSLVGMIPSPALVWGPRGRTRSLRYLDEFVAWAERPESNTVSDGEVVFVGYGITAPEWRWDDYKNRPLAGKVLLMLVNDPGLHDSTMFGGRALTYYGRWTYKLEEAARHGAAGAILIHTRESATYPWDVVRNSWSGEQFTLDTPREPSLAFAGWVTEGVARAALQQTGLDLDSLTRAAGRRSFTPGPTGLHAAVQISSTLRRVASTNVIGRLPGSDPRLAQETVLFTAHWDHKGVGTPVDGDSIYNGAEDNASGVATMLGAAQALVQGPKPRRAITFIATTAEESGLLGAEAYTRQPPITPLSATAAVINLDVMNVRGRTRDISALGGDRSTLGETFRQAAGAESLVVSSEPDLGGHFFRSDHFPFARAGVPALSFASGLDFVGRPANWGRVQDSIWNATRYHQPSDEYSPGFDLAGMAQQARVAVRMAQAVANAPTLPRWLPSSEFQRRRGSR